MSIVKKLHNKLVRVLEAGPFLVPSLNKERLINARSAGNTIRLLEELNVSPKMLVDVGAHNGEWACWIQRRYPSVRILSFEPTHGLSSLGTVLHMALSDEHAQGQLLMNGPSTVVMEQDHSGEVPIRRFDELEERIDRPAVLKVDAESHTARALAGFGKRLQEFDLVVVEMWNVRPDSGPNWKNWKNQQHEIWSTMVGNGFTNHRVVDAGYTDGHVTTYDSAFWPTPVGE